MDVDPTRLRREFGGTDGEVRVVARQAGDLLDSGRLGADRGHELTAKEILSHLRDAPAGSSPVERWNWWMGALEIAYGGYEQFTIRADGSVDG
ncbi:hypothetical protein [Saliphagus sp. LR7]|uniref:hypothetical protein n=1 Tax=Saliphagus sp. LR7 TaxID=2282654 RepID=UPI000DF7D778|nr:hypothetical protein [Saliphagus sp. LR7]